MKTVRIGCGAGFAGDRIDAASILAARGELDYLVFECLAERTIAPRAAGQGSRSTSGVRPTAGSSDGGGSSAVS